MEQDCKISVSVILSFFLISAIVNPSQPTPAPSSSPQSPSADQAADNCGADWNEQAAKSAKNYLEFTSFSRNGLMVQLEYEGFTSEQAEYSADAAGY